MFFPIISPVFASDTQVVIISQVLPNPAGDDIESEWIELENTSSNTIVLNGWTLSDGYGSTSSFSLDGLSIAAHAFLTLYRPDTGIVLNNDAEKVILKDFVGNSIETDIMSKSPEGKAFLLKDGVWHWLDPVAHADNAPYQTPAPVSSPLPIATPNTSPQPTQKQTQHFVLNEVTACGTGPEWIEIKNLSDFALKLDGWSLSSSKVSMLKLDGVHIEAYGLYTVWLPGYYLKNTEDTVKLLERGSIKDQFAYDTCDPKGSWARDDEGQWYATHAITQGQPNDFKKNQTKISENKTTQTVQQILSQKPELPGFFMESPTPLAITSRSAVLGATTHNKEKTSGIPALLFFLGGVLLLSSQHKELVSVSISLISLLRATIRKTW